MCNFRMGEKINSDMKTNPRGGLEKNFFSGYTKPQPNLVGFRVKMCKLRRRFGGV